jgi:hypothetical protein
VKHISSTTVSELGIVISIVIAAVGLVVAIKSYHLKADNQKLTSDNELLTSENEFLTSENDALESARADNELHRQQFLDAWEWAMADRPDRQKRLALFTWWTGNGDGHFDFAPHSAGPKEAYGSYLGWVGTRIKKAHIPGNKTWPDFPCDGPQAG